MRIWLLAMAISACAQPVVTFDSASVKRASSSNEMDVEGAGRIHYSSISLRTLLGKAYDSYASISSPAWLDSEQVEVDAKMPADTTREQWKEMLQNLIVERFQLKFHVETKDVSGYVLAVAKSGSKMKESGEAGEPSFLSEGTPGERAQMVCKQIAVPELARALGRALKSPVTDMTGLKAKYDFTLAFAGHLDAGVIIASLQPPAMSSGGGLSSASGNDHPVAMLPDVFNAVQSQLGLKLERKKMKVEVFVVDHMEKTPGAN